MRRKLLAVFLTGALSLWASLPAGAQSDDFNDGNDDGWIRYDPIAQSGVLPGVGTWSFPGGNTYRIQSAVSPAPQKVGPGRAGSLRTDVTYTDFYVSVDVVNWDTNTEAAFGIVARINNVGLGNTDGYSMTYQVAGGDIDITSFINEDPDPGEPGFGEVPTTGNDVVNMVLGRTYRFVFSGVGPELRARVYEIPFLDEPVADIIGTDLSYSSGICGLLTFDNSGGTLSTDVTFDNYMAATREPPRMSIQLGAFSDVNVFWPTNTGDYILQRSLHPLDESQWEDIPGPYRVFGENHLYEAGDDVYNHQTGYYRLIDRP